MDKEAIVKAMGDRAKGERARVLFDCLMECIEANMDMTVSDIFIRLKEILELEQKAISFLLPTQRMPNEGESPEVYVKSFREKDQPWLKEELETQEAEERYQAELDEKK